MSVDEAQWATPDLQALVELFYNTPAQLGQFSEVTADQIPPDYRELLAHHSHMTVTVERYHDSLVDVDVVDVKETKTHYSRRILLRRQSDRVVVQFGIVRLNLSFLEEEVQQQIRAQQIPLGRVLIEHDVMRNVKLLSLWKIKPGEDLLKFFEVEQLDECFGRTALIYCNGVPAVELLEIVIA